MSLYEESEISMLIGVPRETNAGETRVAATPATIRQLVGLGYDVVVEAGAGALSSFDDDAYAAAGASVGSAEQAWQADVVFRVNGPTVDELALLKDGATIVALLQPALR